MALWAVAVALLAVWAWWVEDRPGRARRRQDRADLRRIRAAQRRVIR